MAKADNQNIENEVHDINRRHFLIYAAAGFGLVGAGSVAWPIINSLNPAADTQALASTEVNLANIGEGQEVTVMWRGKPVFIRHRTAAEIEAARSVDLKELIDPQKDEDRVKAGKDQWLVTVGICTHLGCVPTTGSGEFKAWFCPCHGSHYDTSGRIRKGPAPKNLEVPQYEFISDNVIKIG
jgi:ubiquinol-cytochrome c reductase iron-sulfur subunit